MGEHSMEGVRFFAHKEEEPAPPPEEAPARTKRPAPKPAAGPAKKK
jgi:hypothetical protein